MMHPPDPAHFMRPVQTVGDLQIPPPDPNFPIGQPLDMKNGDKHHIFSPNMKAFRSFAFVRWHDDVGDRKIAELTEIGGGATLMLYVDQILKLEKENRIVAFDGRRKDMLGMPGAVHMLRTEEVAEAIRRISYVDRMLAAERLRDEDTPLTEEWRLVIMGLVALERGEKRPSIEWMYKMLRIEHEVSALNRFVKFAPIRSKGNRKPRFDIILYEIKWKAIEHALKAKLGASDARLRVKYLVAEGQPFHWARHLALDENGEPKMKQSSFTKGVAKLDKYTKALWRRGEEYANRKYGRAVLSERPTGILDIVDVDYTLLPITVYDPVLPELAYGRPYIIAFRDRYSGIVLGYAISFSAPSFHTLLAGFRHALFPKGEEDSAVPWPWFGKWKRLGVDWEAHFVGTFMKSAELMLEFELVQYRKRTPEDKAALEHHFYLLDIGAIRSLPGHAPRPTDRDQLDHDLQDVVPEISIVELREILDDYYANHVNRKPTKGIGELPKVEAIPADVWNESRRDAPPRGLVDPQVFTWLAGVPQNVTIQGNGVLVRGLWYQSAELIGLDVHPDHRDGVRKEDQVHGGTEYVSTTDPEELGYVWVIDHHRGNYPIRVPIDPSLASYANRLNLYQHELVLAHRKEQLEKTGKEPSFQKAFEALRNKQMDFHVQASRDHWSTKVARHMERQTGKIMRAKAVDLTWVESGGRTSLSEESTLEVREPVSHRAVRRPQTGRKTAADAPPVIVDRYDPMSVATASGMPPIPSPPQETTVIKEPAPRSRPSIAELKKHRNWEERKD
ncbi:hypothetical protein [Rhizobium leguminosarum]|uniref:hypothetical protein n=1 Tax=Rhizobium leguminosarum TaxID=384 RepID=UPI0015F9D9AF|nr:hypothetical protein [Rhizobium leguminosarum]MBA8835431.1 putative transposase [Rhizobium leguminosarum]